MAPEASRQRVRFLSFMAAHLLIERDGNGRVFMECRY
jgi:hypothetical protein